MKKNDSAHVSHVTEILRVEGVGCKGFGILPKFVALDMDLSIGAKAVYAYFCSLAGSGTCAFPRRDTIISHLGINKDTYYKFYNELLEMGYLTAYQERKSEATGFSRNIYTLVQNPERFKRMKLKDIPVKDGYDNVYIQGMTQYGYGIIPRLVMMDPRLDIKAKGIYAYYVAHTGAGQCVQLKRGLILKHLGISNNTYYKYLSMLIDLDYITTEQKKINGRFSSTRYILNSNPDAKKSLQKIEEIPDLPCTKFSDTQDVVEKTENNELKYNLPCTKFSDTGKKAPCTKFSDTQNSDTNNNNINCDTNNPSIPKSLPSKPSVKEGKERELLFNRDGSLREDVKLDYELAEMAIRQLFSRQDFAAMKLGEDDSYYELYVNVLASMISSSELMKAKGAVFNYSHVIKRINSIMAVSSMPNKQMEFLCFSRDFLKYFTGVLRYNDVNDIMTYTKSVMWDWLNTYAVKRTVEKSAFKYANLKGSDNSPESYG